MTRLGRPRSRPSRPLEALCRDLAARMGVVRPAVLRSPFLFSPCLDGLRRPVILLPEDVAENLRETFVHELAHLARRDGLWNLVRRSSVAALWVQPLLWVLSRRLEGAAEEVCDDYVVQFGADRTHYAGHLLELAGRALPPVTPAGVGMISLRSMLARRIVRLLDTSRSLSTRAGTRAVLAMLVVGLAGTVLAGLLGVGSGKDEALAQLAEAKGDAKDEPKRESNGEVVGGQVVGPDGKPGHVVDLGTDNLVTGKRIEAGVAKAEAADVPINGRIVDLEGRPVAGVSVTVQDVHGPKTGDLTAWIEGVKKGEPPWIAYHHLGADVKIPENFRREVTDRERRPVPVRGTRGGAGCRAQDQGGHGRVHVDRRRHETDRAVPRPRVPGHSRARAQTVYGSDFTYTANPGRPVEGVVRDAKTGRPMAGVSVQSWRFAGSDFVDTRQLKTASDENGRFRLVGMPKGKGNVVIAVPGDDQPYFMREAPVGDPPGIGPVPVEIELHRGVMITGKITDKSTGKPVAEARLHYLPFLENTFVQALPEFDKHGNVNGFQTRYTTGADGTYKLVGMPGRAIVGVESVGKATYRTGVGSDTIKGLDNHGNYKTWHNPIWPGRAWPNTLVEIDPAAGTETLTVDAQLDPGLTLRIKVVDADGKPVPDASVDGGSRMRAGESTPEALYTLSSFRPDEVRNVVVRHDARSLGKVVRLRAGEDASGPVLVTMAPTAKIRGRVVGADGNPVPAATVRVDVHPTEGFIHQLTNVAADRDGRFEVSNVPVGCEYGLVAEVRHHDQAAAGRVRHGERQAGRNDRRRRDPVQRGAGQRARTASGCRRPSNCDEGRADQRADRGSRRETGGGGHAPNHVVCDSSNRRSDTLARRDSKTTSRRQSHDENTSISSKCLLQSPAGQ